MPKRTPEGVLLSFDEYRELMAFLENLERSEEERQKICNELMDRQDRISSYVAEGLQACQEKSSESA